MREAFEVSRFVAQGVTGILLSVFSPKVGAGVAKFVSVLGQVQPDHASTVREFFTLVSCIGGAVLVWLSVYYTWLRIQGQRASNKRALVESEES